MILSKQSPLLSCEIIRRSSYSHGTIFRKLTDLTEQGVVIAEVEPNGARLFSYDSSLPKCSVCSIGPAFFMGNSRTEPW